ncbi:MAG: phospholipase A [Acidobacteria bacterium]|nr:phospholipase A [Acidobacteriota bacterium]
MSFSPRSRIALPLALAALAAFSASGLAAAPQAAEPEKKTSYFTELWQLDRAARASQPGITFHRSNAALVFSYNDRPNPARLWRDLFGKDICLWAAYTQRSFWQLYNFDDSSPFRETNYEPEVLLNFGTRYRFLGFEGRFFQFGVNHQSNGQSEPLSRSWNRLVANIGIERGPLSLLVKGWWRVPDSDDDNPGLTHYVGNGELWAYYFIKKHRLGVMLRDNLNFRENRGAVQVEWSFPMFAMVAGYVQYFLGYGESLLDYDHRVHRVGVGFILSDWY